MEQQSVLSVIRMREQFGNDNIVCTRSRTAKSRLASAMDGRLLVNCESHYQDLKPQPRSTIAADFDPEGRLLASTHGDHTVKIFEWGSLQPVRVLSGHRRTPWVISWHPLDRNILVTGSLDSDVRIWNTQTGRCIKQRTFEKPIASMAFHPNGDLLAVAAGHRIYFLRWKDDQSPPRSVYRAKKSVRAVAFHPHGHPLFVTAEVNEKRGEEALRPPESGTQCLQQRLLEEASMAFSSTVALCQRPQNSMRSSGQDKDQDDGGSQQFLAFSPPSEADLRFRMPNYAVDSSAAHQAPAQSRLQLQQQLQQQLLLNPQGQLARLALGTESLNNFSGLNLNFVAPFTLAPPPSMNPSPQSSSSSSQQQVGMGNRQEIQSWPAAAQQMIPNYGAIAVPDASLLQQPGMLFSPMQYLMELVGHRHQMQGFPPLHINNNQLPQMANSDLSTNPRFLLPNHPSGQSQAQEVPAAVPIEEIPVTTVVKLWHLSDANLGSKPPKLSKPSLVIHNAVLCSEMGLHISPCGRYLALCCAVAHPSLQQPQQSAQPSTWPPIRVGYELRVYSIESRALLWRRAVRVGMCLTSVQWSPSSDYLLVAYGRKHIALLRESVDRSDGSVSTTHTIMEIYKVKGLKLVCVLPSSEDEVNVATWHPVPGQGIVYGTKEGRLRILKINPPSQQPPPDQNTEQQDRNSVVVQENEIEASDDE
eukprot:TRINITY_DN3426_c0_g1_i1.p1 TRINITY_DN3426_c0_g1~~TRINITY_DN3426_c0_g1_i1.p1  ORF type:complete len:700 (-),score=69.59 TRINITY_DN3426_c0_g1_i1:4159-6258(-)